MSSDLYRIERPIYDYGTFGEKYQEVFRRKKSLLEMASDGIKQQCGCTAQNWANRLWGLIPFVNMIRQKQYNKTDFVSDIITGFTICVFHIPQGLAYGLQAGVKPINGLYTSFIPVLIFAVFGRSRHLSIGTFSLMALLLSDMVESNYEAYLPRIKSNASLPLNYTATDYARLQTVIVGSFTASLVILAIGLVRLGFVMRYMSDAMLKGFTTAAAVQAIVSQLPLLLGVKPERATSHFRIPESLIKLSQVIQSTNLVTLGLALGCCVVIYLVKQFVNPLVKKKSKVPIPIELIVIIVTLLATRFTDLHEKYLVAIVGDVPRGLPLPLVPDMGFIPTVLPSAIAVSVVGSAITMSLAKMYCLQFQYSYDFNEDFVIFGASSLVSSFFQCFFACGALARNAVVVSVGMKSQLANMISCLGLLLVLLWVGNFFESIPTCVLGAVIVVSLINVVLPVRELPHIYRISRVDFAVFVVSGVAVLVLDVTFGLAIGFAFNLFSVVLRTQVPPTAVLGRVADTDIYEDLLVFPAARTLPGIAILRFNTPVNYANAEGFAEFADKLGQETPSTSRKNGAIEASEAASDVHTVIFDCSSWFYVDMVGVRTIKETNRLLSERGLRVLYAACKDLIRASFAKQEFTPVTAAGLSAFFVTIHDAVLFAERAESLPAINISAANSDPTASTDATATAIAASLGYMIDPDILELTVSDIGSLIVNQSTVAED